MFAAAAVFVVDVVVVAVAVIGVLMVMLMMTMVVVVKVALVDIRGRVNKRREEESDYFSTAYEGLKEDYLDAHIPGAVFVDWTKVNTKTPLLKPTCSTS